MNQSAPASNADFAGFFGLNNSNTLLPLRFARRYPPAVPPLHQIRRQSEATCALRPVSGRLTERLFPLPGMAPPNMEGVLVRKAAMTCNLAYGQAELEDNLEGRKGI